MRYTGVYSIVAVGCQIGQLQNWMDPLPEVCRHKHLHHAAPKKP